VATTEQEADRLNELLAELRRRLALGFSHVGEAAIVDAGSARERATKVIVGQRALPPTR
jgi:hypothetical protein